MRAFDEMKAGLEAARHAFLKPMGRGGTMRDEVATRLRHEATARSQRGS
jgi:hypothetical protein